MGKVWKRDGPTQESTAPKPGFPQKLKGRTNVWKRAAPLAPETNGIETQNTGGNSFEQTPEALDPDSSPAAKRRRLAAQGRLPQQPAAHNGPSSSQREPFCWSPANGASHRTDSSGAHEDSEAKKKEEALRKEAEALRWQIAEEEAKVSAAKREAKRKEIERELAKERAERERQEERGKRKARLDAGFAEAFRATREAQASPAAPKVTAASEAEVARVLGAKSDHEVMQLMPGAEAAAIKKKYRTMTLALHPDKCKAEKASDAFQRLLVAYQGVLKFAR